MLAYKLIRRATAFYTLRGILIGGGAVFLFVLLRGLYANTVSAGAGVADVIAGSFFALAYALAFGAIPATVSSLLLSICFVVIAPIRKLRAIRAAFAAAIGWTVTALFLFVIFREGRSLLDWSALSGSATLPLIGAFAGGVAGLFDPEKEPTRAA